MGTYSNRFPYSDMEQEIKIPLADYVVLRRKAGLATILLCIAGLEFGVVLGCSHHIGELTKQVRGDRR